MAETVWTITELQRTGAGVLVEAAEGARFVWTGNAHTSPHAFVEIPTQVNTVRTVYPGTEQPVEQVLSTEIPPFQITGEWDDKFAGDGFARRQERDMEALVRRGSLVRMDFEQFSLVGIITNYTRRLMHRTRIGYTLMFSPHYRDSEESTVRTGVAPARSRPLRDIALESEVVVLGLEAAQATGELLELTDLSFRDSADEVAEARETQDAINERASEGLTDNSDEEIETQEQRYASLQGSGETLRTTAQGSRTDIALGFDSGLQRLRFELWTRGLRSNSRVLISQSSDARVDFQLLLEPEIKRVIRPRADESLYHVSNQFYSAPENWRIIATASSDDELRFDGTVTYRVPVER